MHLALVTLGLGSLTGLAYLGSRTSAGPELTTYSGVGRAFGKTVSVRVLHHDPVTAQAAIADALQQVSTVDALMSLHQAVQPGLSAQCQGLPEQA